MPAITLEGHMSTGHGGFPPRPSVEGCPRVTVGGISVHCEGQAWAPHSSGGSTHVGYLAQGAPHVTIGGRGVGRVGDPITCGDKVAQGCENVTVGNCGGEDFGKDMIFKSLTDPKDKLILCLEEIALAEAGRKNTAKDARGWKYLAAMLNKWFSGKANNNASSNPNPFWVDWDWIMEFERARNHYGNFVFRPGMGEIPSNIHNTPSREQIGSYLARDGLLGDSKVSFDYTALPWNEWLGRAFNFRKVPAALSADGLQAAMGAFTFRALAKGFAEPGGNGAHKITVTECSVFVYDAFNFEGEAFLRYWDCADKTFSPFWGSEQNEVYNSYFNSFRNKLGFGNDFRVLSPLHVIENFQETQYVFP